MLEKPFYPSYSAYPFLCLLFQCNDHIKLLIIARLPEFKAFYLWDCFAAVLELLKSGNELFSKFVGVDRITRIFVIVFRKDAKNTWWGIIFHRFERMRDAGWRHFFVFFVFPQCLFQIFHLYIIIITIYIHLHPSSKSLSLTIQPSCNKKN